MGVRDSPLCEQSLLNFKIDEMSVQTFEGVDYSREAVRAREKDLLRAKRIELMQDVRVCSEASLVC